MHTSWMDLAKKDAMKVVGLISGTSADAVDAALCEISGSTPADFKFKLLQFHSEPYSALLQRKILGISDASQGLTDELCRLNYRLGETFARAADKVIEAAGLPREKLDLIGSHGQTVAHLPPRSDKGPMATGIIQRYGSTLQLAEPAVIAERLGVPVISNFRSRDMAAGGQGAPLVPYVDYLIFSNAEKTRALINIGGISNVTYLPKGGKMENILAFDTGPGNMIIDCLIQQMTVGRESYDKDGATAAKGQVDGAVLSELIKHPYLKMEPPKSTGREEFGEQYAHHIYQWGIKRSVKPTDIVRTCTDFTAIAIAEAYKKFLAPKGAADEIIVSGGGALNPLLMARLRKEFGAAKVQLSDDFGVPLKAKEAISFAVLARETILGRPANLPSATGAAGPRILGQITPA